MPSVCTCLWYPAGAEEAAQFYVGLLPDSRILKVHPMHGVGNGEEPFLIEFLLKGQRYTAMNGGSMDNNPSPGNKAGGLTTILEKSLGAMAKAGSTNLVDVVNYAEAVTRKGFVFMDTPGYDPVAATGQVAGGANMVCFTTGRGSVFGCKPAPSIKLATNSPMYRRMEDDMDINCGTILDGEESVQQCGQRIFDLMLRVASGERTKSESFDFGGAEFAPWVLGATM